MRIHHEGSIILEGFLGDLQACITVEVIDSFVALILLVHSFSTDPFPEYSRLNKKLYPPAHVQSLLLSHFDKTRGQMSWVPAMTARTTTKYDLRASVKQNKRTTGRFQYERHDNVSYGRTENLLFP